GAVAPVALAAGDDGAGGAPAAGAGGGGGGFGGVVAGAPAGGGGRAGGAGAPPRAETPPPGGPPRGGGRGPQDSAPWRKSGPLGGSIVVPARSVCAAGPYRTLLDLLERLSPAIGDGADHRTRVVSAPAVQMSTSGSPWDQDERALHHVAECSYLFPTGPSMACH